MKNDVAEMDQLVSQLLNYARFEQHRLALNCEAGDMPNLASDIVLRLTGHDPQRSAQQIYIQADVPHPLVCDWPLMERALLNLVQNALHYSRSQVRIRLLSDAKSFYIEVEDDGPGIPADEQQRVFESFVRLRQSLETHATGFGLGLAKIGRASCRERAERSGEAAES